MGKLHPLPMGWRRSRVGGPCSTGPGQKLIWVGAVHKILDVL